MMLSRMRAAGLAEGVGLAHTTLETFLSRYFSSLIGKSATRTFYSHTRRNLEEFFGTGRLLRTITPADADAFRAWLVEHAEIAADGSASVRRLSPSTVARRIIAARTIWRQAARWKLASENPFTGVKGGHQSNEGRKAFVPRHVIEAAIEEAPDDEWKVIIALARYGGLRCPSEHFALRWADVDFDAGRITVRSPKTEHHEGHEYRVIPLFPELREHLWNLFTQAAAEGTVHVIARHRLGGLNLRQQFLRILQRSGIKPWPKLFHNLRASRETELMREYDLATVCKWIGNSPAVAAKHYAMSVDLNADFSRAAGRVTEGQQAQQNAQQSAAGRVRQPMTSDWEIPQTPREIEANDNPGQLPASGVIEGVWAIQDSNL